MSWTLEGEMLEACSCKMNCRCVFGPAEPDQGWCSAALTFLVDRGSSDGMELSGTRLTWAIDLPGDFVGGNGTARLYVDAPDDKARELEAIVTGKRGGFWAEVGAAITKWLPTQQAKIEVTGGELRTVSVTGIGEITLNPVKTPSGKKTTMSNVPLNEAFGVVEEELAMSEGSFADPEMRSWQPGGAGGTSRFSWSG